MGMNPPFVPVDAFVENGLGPMEKTRRDAHAPRLNLESHSPLATLLHQLAQRCVIDQVLRPAGGVVDGRGGRIDAEVVIQRGKDLAEGDGPAGGQFTQPVGGPPGPSPSAGALPRSIPTSA